MVKKPKKRIVLLLVLLCGGSVWYVLNRWLDAKESERRDRAVIDIVIPADVNRDGQDDLLLMYASLERDENTHRFRDPILEALDISTGEIYWSTRHERDRARSNPWVYKTNGAYAGFVDVDGGWFQLSVYSVETGVRLWEHSRTGEFFLGFWWDEELLIVGSHEIGSDDDNLVALDIRSGEMLWEAVVHPYGIQYVSFWPDAAVVWSYGCVHTIDRVTGQLTTFELTGDAFATGEGAVWLEPAEGEDIYCLGSQPFPTEQNDLSASGATEICVDQPASSRQIFFGREQLVSFQQTGIQLVSVTSGQEHFAPFPEGFHSLLRRANAVLAFPIEGSVGSVITERFLPLVLQRGEFERRLAVLDLDTGDWVWLSDVAEPNREFSFSQPRYADGLFLIGISIGDGPNSSGLGQTALLIFDANEGRFTGALELLAVDSETGIQRRTQINLHASPVTGGLLFDWSGPWLWAIDVQNTRLIDTLNEDRPYELQLVSIWDDVENVLGPLPR